MAKCSRMLKSKDLPEVTALNPVSLQRDLSSDVGANKSWQTRQQRRGYD